MTRVAPLLAMSFASMACATSLRSELDEHPNGRFAEGVLARRATASRPPSTTPPQPSPPSLDPVAPKPAGPSVVRRGPVDAGDLRIVGLEVEDGALEPFRREWPAAERRLEYRQTRLAFLARSPTVAEAVQHYRAAFERYGQIEALDDLVRQYDAFAGELTTGATTPIVKPSPAKRFPFGGVSSLQGRLAGVDVTLARVTLEQTLLSALAEFERAWQGAYYWQRAVAILAEVTDLSGRLVDAARARYRVGSTSHANLIHAEIRHEALSVRLTSARARRGAARVALAASLDLPPDALERTSLVLNRPRPARPDRHATAAAALDHGPEVALARAARERAALMVELAKRQLQPNLSEGAEIPGSGPRPPAADLMYATGGPFVRELEVRDQAAAEALAAAERRAPAVADEAWVTLDDARRRHASSAGSQLSRARQGVEVTERGYRAGTATFFDLDSAVQLYLTTALDARASLRDAHIASARLAVVTGTGVSAQRPREEDPDD